MQSALDMMEELDRLNARWRSEGRPTLAIGIGLNVGDVFAGNIGSDRRLEYTVIGDPVNVSSRLCGAAGLGADDRVFQGEAGIKGREATHKF